MVTALKTGPGWETRGWKAPGPSWERPDTLRIASLHSPLDFPSFQFHCRKLPLLPGSSSCWPFFVFGCKRSTLGKLPSSNRLFNVSQSKAFTGYLPHYIPPPSGDTLYACIPSSLSCLVQVQHASRNSEAGCAQRPKRGEHSLARSKMRVFYPLRSLHLAGR